MIKSEARKQALAIRKNLCHSYFNKSFFEELFKDKKNIGIYYPLNGEIDLRYLVDEYPNLSFLFPSINNDEMCFKKLDNKGFIKASFHTMEPLGEVVLKDNIDLIIVPCVAINHNNYRLGYGKGYYDKYMSDYKGQSLVIINKELVLEFKEESHDFKAGSVILV